MVSPTLECGSWQRKPTLGAEADQARLLFVLHRFSPLSALTCLNARVAGSNALAVEDSRHYDIRLTATRIMMVVLIFDEHFLPLGQPNHLKGGAGRPPLPDTTSGLCCERSLMAFTGL